MFAVEFDDSLSVEALLRAAVVFKFSKGSEADIYVGSPRYAAALRAMLEAVVAGRMAASDPESAEGWRKAYRLSAHRERWQMVAAYVQRHPDWGSMSEEEAAGWVSVVASPYWLSESETRRMAGLGEAS
ncbi:hypothetical protein [Streptomyces phytohabitans]|uniref:hypothetical protein n=1 Tax=Streptomyces phytohabitans TaxID=1150371 RepID=UPI00345BB24F